jgi:glycosyltransferase involved in cell wall biosynthesis
MQRHDSVSMPSISVVMRTYADAENLPQTIESVLRQDFVDLQCIVVNDGSPDALTSETLARYAEIDRRIIVRSKANEGITRTLIDACNRAEGRYIARIDAGDVMLPGRLAAQAKVMDQQPDCAFVSCWT